jgi:hypothetical protein
MVNPAAMVVRLQPSSSSIGFMKIPRIGPNAGTSPKDALIEAITTAHP